MAALLAATGPRLHYWTRPRGGDKTSGAAGASIAWELDLAEPREQGYVVASDADQGALVIEAAAGYLARTPELTGIVKVETRRIVNVASGAAVNVLAADGPSAYGLRGSWFVADELAQWPNTTNAKRVWEAVLSAIPKRRGARLLVITSAGDPASFAYRVLQTARTSSAWRVSEIAGPLPWIDSADLEEQARLLTESQFQRLHLNAWCAPEDRLATPDRVRACVTHAGQLAPVRGRRYVIGVDLGVKSDASVVAVCHGEGLGDERRIVVDMVRAFVPRKDAPVDLAVVEEAIRHASRTYNRAHVRIDPWQGLLLARNLRTSGVQVEEYAFSAQSVGRIALTIFGLLRDGRIGLPDDDDLIEELERIRLRESSPGVFRLDHDPDAHDDRAVAIALAAHALTDRGAYGRARTSARNMLGMKLPDAPIRAYGAMTIQPVRGSGPLVVGGWRGPRRGYDPRIDGGAVNTEAR
jgi:phage terminase large subunit-like protein